MATGRVELFKFLNPLNRSQADKENGYNL
jgi:hypothetical protein